MVRWNPWGGDGQASTSKASQEQPNQASSTLAKPPTSPSDDPLPSSVMQASPFSATTTASFLATLSPTIPFASFSLGFFSGLITQSNRAGLVFMAENAHRRPDTVQGWYFYNKTKNYRVLLAGLKGGFALGTRLAAWTTLFVLLDGGSAALRNVVQQEGSGPVNLQASAEGSSRFASSLGRWTDGIVAGQGTAVVASIVHRLPPARLLALGTLAGGTTGALQDVRDRLRPQVDAEAQS
ncbi:hypothetical protein BDZ90DRAFT_231286 [Jaminaea rosea]|uniref:Tim17-domain-containing protein n=1 Tax=Jaminaea rosea TaxID=1569628 RepID=A0A316USN8_9BASI|nr:hypothetical protein BDZ90DRAFT_231286 [Jaminaea rosea]PWN28292.1 hypothetical protein BDZ90DRAFT_231286 [Jaminaea rosea]